MTLAFIGSTGGLAIGLGLARVAQSRLYGVAFADAFSLAASAMVLWGIAVLASWLPARRAASIDPLVALRLDE